MNEINRTNILKSIEPRFNLYVKRMNLNFKSDNLKEVQKYISMFENIMDFIDNKWILTIF